ncbi:MAG: hypothetical protein SynsKO_06230 [Synoicihabitans sp.]
MKKPPLLTLILLLSIGSAAHAAHHASAEKNQIAAVTAADAERMAATIAGDRGRLEAVLSKDLRYAHSSGTVEDRAAFIDTLITERVIYKKFTYQERNFTPVGSDAVAMSGRVLIDVVVNAKDISVDLNFLSVWRKENGHWRFLAWQSCTNPPASGK